MSKIADAMKYFHKGTIWEVRSGMMAELAIEDTNAKITNYYVMHGIEWKHDRVVDFVSMDEGTGEYTVYALCADGFVLCVPEDELENPERVEYGGQVTYMVRTMPRFETDVDGLADRIVAERERILREGVYPD